MSIVKVVNAIPNDHSNEQNQDSEPSIAVNPNNPSEIVLTAFTPPDNGVTGGPLYYSSDGGTTWFFYFDVPGGEPNDQSIGFAGLSNELYTAVLRGDIFKQLAVSRTDNPPVNTSLPALDPRSNIDQPWVETRSVIGGTDGGKDRLYVGYNNDGAGPGNPSATIDVCLDALAGSPTFTPVVLEHRTVGAGLADGYAIRPAAHYDGTVYAVYEGWRSGMFNADITTDIVVARDDNWGNGTPPFQALIDPDTKPGRIVQSGVVINDGGVMGQERLNNDLAIAVDPTNSDIVYVAWADNAGPNYTLRVRRSLNRGVAWSGDLLTVDNATMAGLAMNIGGQVGLMYQELNGANWETHFRRTTDTSGTNWNDLTLSITPSATPLNEGQPYLGDWARVVAVGRTFYGVFCANNTPDPANFPQGVSFPRNHTTSAPFRLLGTDNTTVIPISIDPFFFSVTDLDPASDFYVRDWTDSMSSGDNGAEPSTHPDFFSTSDVWNQYSSNVAFSPNANDQILGENASSGSSSGAVNYAFARIRRNVLPAAGSGAVSVSAHFLISEFGTGSNFTDWVFADPSDPDVTFPVESDVSVSFGDTEFGPKIVPPYQWNLGPTASNHLCLAVEIASPGDPFASPGLTGRAPGASDISIVNDNNKAQHNLQVYLSGHGSHGATYYGIIHNAGLDTRDMVLQIAGAGQRAPAGATLEIVTEKGSIEKRPWRPWDRIALPAMLPGENRWLGITIPTPAGSDTRIPVTIFELPRGLAVNGFTIAAQPAAPADVVASNLTFHQTVFARLNAAFGIAAAASEVSAAGAFPSGTTPIKKGHDEDSDLNIEQDVTVTSQGMKIEVHLRISGRPEDRDRKVAVSSTLTYESFLKGRAANILQCFNELLKTVTIADAFGIGAAISTMKTAGDEAALLTAHATLLHKLDAFMTMLKKAKGDRADILQNVLWQIRLYTTSSVLSAFPEATNIVALSRAYAAAVAARTARIGDYAVLLAGLSALFDQTAAHLPGLNLSPLIGDIIHASSAREQQRAHHQFLLRLQAGT